MIRLLLKIRHKLLSDDNYATYILYASGQMLLVVVGILSALQIGNWNEAHIERVINSYTEMKNSRKSGLNSSEDKHWFFTKLELCLSNLQSILNERLHVQLIRIDDIAVYNINFLKFARLQDPYLKIVHEKGNVYPGLLTDHRIRNLLAIKLN